MKKNTKRKFKIMNKNFNEYYNISKTIFKGTIFVLRIILSPLNSKKLKIEVNN